MHNSITELKLNQRRGLNKFIVSGRAEEPNGTLFIIRFYDNDNSVRGQTIVKVMDGEMGSIQDVMLERGLYSVGLQKCLDVRTKKFAAEEKLEEKIIAGEAYAIDVYLEEQIMYGHRGIKVTVINHEKAMGNNEIYYQILKAGNLYNKIHYWVPMNDSSQSEFFIADIKPQEVRFRGVQEDIYKINLYTDGGR